MKSIRSHSLLEALALLTVPVVGAVVCWVALSLPKQTAPVLAGVTQVTTQLNTALAEINKPQSGTIAETNTLIHEGQTMVVHVDMAARHEDQQLATLDAQEAQIFTDVHSGLVSFKDTTDAAGDTLRSITAHTDTVLDTANTTVGDLDSRVNEFKGTSAALTKSINDFNDLITSPPVTRMLDNGATITDNLGKTTTDFQLKFHSVLFPPKCEKLCYLQRLGDLLKYGPPLAEGTYFGIEAAKALGH